MVNKNNVIDYLLHYKFRINEIFENGGSDYHTMKGAFNLKIFMKFGLKGKELIIRSIKNEIQISNSRTY